MSAPLPPPELMAHAMRLDPDNRLQQELAEQVDWFDPADLAGTFDRSGLFARNAILNQLPEGWSWRDRRVLDFGCGPGRVLRHFLDEAREAEFYGCELDEDCVGWMTENLSPVRVLQSGEHPPLDLPDNHLDLVWAHSVFTHLTDTWSDWLADLHRVLKPDGELVVTYAGEGFGPALEQEPWLETWDDDRIGMNVLAPGAPWSEGGPMVLHSRWWIEAHWGRAFDIVDWQALSEPQSGVVLRPKPVEVTPADLERDEPGEPRELAARRHAVEQQARYDRRQRDALAWQRAHIENLTRALDS